MLGKLAERDAVRLSLIRLRLTRIAYAEPARRSVIATRKTTVDFISDVLVERSFRGHESKTCEAEFS